MTEEACPGGCRLQALLEDGEAWEEADELFHHLESCSACQETLQELAAPPDVWDCTAQGLRDEARAEPALHHLMQRLKEEIPPMQDGGLSFLRPADTPDVLALLDRYEVQEVIGRGGMGVVLKAVDPDLNRVVAIKILSPWLAHNATARRRFVREAKAAAAVCHDHIVTVHGVHEAEGLPYLVMQYVAGESLQARLDRTGSLAVEEVVRIGLQTAKGLAAAHAHGLIHRDIKPANLLLEDGDARVKITDFGLARMADEGGLTQDGVIVGTPEYMAPEQARGEGVDHRADLFSLGSVLYACCAGSRPFRGATVLAVLAQVSEKEPASIRSLHPDVPVWLETFIGRLMAKDPDQRFQSAAEAATLLESYRAPLRQPALAPAPEVPSSPLVARPGRPRGQRPMTTRKWTLAAVGLVLVLGLLAALMVHLFSSQGVSDVDLRTSPTGALSAQGAAPLEPVDGLICLLVNKNSGRCLSIEDGSAKQGARIVQGPMPEQARAVERWTLLGAGAGFRLRNESSGLVLEIGSGNRDPGVQAIQWHDQVKVPSQHWIFEPAEDSYVLRAEHSQLVLGIGQSSLEEGAAAVQWHYVPDVADQCWELRPPYRQEASWPLRGEPQDHSIFGLFGPDAEQYVHFEPAGLRIAFPPGGPKDRAESGVTLATTIRGDFETTVRFEILQEPEAAAARRETRFTLHVVMDDPDRGVVTLGRQSGIREGNRFLASMRREDGDGGKPLGVKELLTTAKSGRLRLVRSGAALSCYVSEGADGPLTFLKRYAFRDKDVKEIRLTGAADPEAAFEVRVADLRIRADSLPNVPKSVLAQSAPPKTQSRAWLVGGTVAVLVVLLLLAVSLGSELYGRQRRRPKDEDAAAPVSFACSGCGKKLKARAVLAGKKVKCPQCGQSVSVPSIQAPRSPADSTESAEPSREG